MPGAYNSLLQPNLECVADVCICPQGRSEDETDGLVLYLELYSVLIINLIGVVIPQLSTFKHIMLSSVTHS